jgi:hypothetical protein
LKSYVLVEGHGEVDAVGNLIHRVSAAMGFHAPWALPIRWKNIHLVRGIEKGVQFIRSKGDAGEVAEGCVLVWVHHQLEGNAGHPVAGHASPSPAED